MGPVYTVNVPLQCRRVCIYVKTDFLYYFVFMMISAVLAITNQISRWDENEQADYIGGIEDFDYWNQGQAILEFLYYDYCKAKYDDYYDYCIYRMAQNFDGGKY